MRFVLLSGNKRVVREFNGEANFIFNGQLCEIVGFYRSLFSDLNSRKLRKLSSSEVVEVGSQPHLPANIYYPF